MISLTPFSLIDDFDIIFKAYTNDKTQSLISNRIIVKSKEIFRDWLTFQLQNYYHEFKIINYNDIKIGFCYSYEYTDGTIKTALYVNDDYQNSGLGVIAEITFIDYLLNLYPLRKIYNHVYSYNEQSLTSHLKAGFNTEGKLLEYRYFSGKYHDVYILSITREEFYKRYGKLLTDKQKGTDDNANQNT